MCILKFSNPTRDIIRKASAKTCDGKLSQRGLKSWRDLEEVLCCFRMKSFQRNAIIRGLNVDKISLFCKDFSV